MSTIRPLATITALAVVGVFLAMKINEGPGLPTDSLTPEWETTAPPFAPGDAPPALQSSATASEGGPKLPPVATNEQQPLENTEAPSFSLTAPTAPGATAGQSAASNASAVPELPPLPTLPESSATPTAASTAPSGSSASSSDGVVIGAVPSLGTSTPGYSASPYVATNPTAASAEMPAYPVMPPLTGAAAPVTPPASVSAPRSAYSQATEIAPPQPVTPEMTPVAAATAPSGFASQPPAPGLANTAAPSDDSEFTTAMQVIQTALERDELTRAHTLLSQWYADESLTPDQRTQVDRLLGQLAGTVVYSTEHRLTDPYTVKSGDTLESVAREYGVPWQLLAKINGVPRSDAVTPGQTLKVVRGPFSAMVDLSESELALMIDGKFAGRFPVQLEGQAMQEGQWRVDQKQLKPAGPSDRYGMATSTEKQITLTGPGGSLVLGDAASQGAPDAGSTGRIAVALGDLDELHDILSVGSEVTIRR